MLRRVLSRQVTVGGVLETLLYLAVVYLAVGFAVTFFHMPYVYMLETQWEEWMPAGANMAALVQITVMWPGLLLTSHLCMM